MNHGTRKSYQRGCSCRLCCAAHAEYSRRKRTERRGRCPEQRIDIVHGISCYVNHGCRCPAAVSAKTRANAEQQRRRTRQYEEG